MKRLNRLWQSWEKVVLWLLVPSTAAQLVLCSGVFSLVVSNVDQEEVTLRNHCRASSL